MLHVVCAAVSEGMPSEPPDDAKSDESKPGRKFRFTVPRSKGRGMWLVDGQWHYEGAEIELGKAWGKIAAEMWRDGKLWWDGEAWQTGPRPAPVPPPPPSKLDAALQAFNASRNTEKLELLMRSIGSAIEQLREHSRSVSNDGGLDDVESDTIEALLGSALLSCRSHVQVVLRCIEAIRPLVRRRKAVRGTVLAEGRRTHDLLDLPSTRTVGSYSLIQVMLALAAYYKEHDQWPARWTAAKGDAKRTISILSAAGIMQHTPQKLQTAIGVIGVTQYSNLDLLGIICDHWGNILDTQIRDVLQL